MMGQCEKEGMKGFQMLRHLCLEHLSLRGGGNSGMKGAEIPTYL